MALQIWTASYPDPAEQTYFFFSTKTLGDRWNWSYWKNDRATELCDTVMTEFSQQKRIDAVREIQKLGVDNAVYVYLYQVPHCVAMRDNVSNLWVHPGAPDLLPFAVEKKK
jgi:ABC-type transport system substrate-binding protein